MPDLQPFQQRVVAEKKELDGRLDRLNDFLGSEQFKALPERERMLLTQQSHYMLWYSNALGERIKDFSEPS